GGGLVLPGCTNIAGERVFSCCAVFEAGDAGFGLKIEHHFLLVSVFGLWLMPYAGKFIIKTR
ncbi:MAG: hypothetical protein ACLFMP_07165, partial [Desulfonatronovibrionaceae bacterium]